MSIPSLARPRTLLEAVLPDRVAQRWTTDLVLIALFSGFVALTAHVEIPLPLVPLTLQTLGVLLTGAVLGSRRGGAALVLYLIEGALGLPVFAGGAAGVAYMIGPTAGYLTAFPLAAAVVGWLAERRWDRHWGWAALAMIAGNLVIYALGVGWLSWFVGSFGKAIAAGLLPFIPGDLIKIAVAALVLPGAWRLVHR